MNYIESVLAGEEDRSEKIGALEAILADVLVSERPETRPVGPVGVADSSRVARGLLCARVARPPRRRVTVHVLTVCVRRARTT